MSRLILFDTSNFTDFPIGGQLTSIHNILRYIAEGHGERMQDIILVGLTLQREQIGRMQRVDLFGHKVKFFPVMQGEKDLDNTTKSIRVQYVKGILKYIGRLAIRRRDVCYINTPEAYAPLFVKCPWAHFVAFSHQNYFEMRESFRFYRDKQWVLTAFDTYLKFMVGRMGCIFVLNSSCEKAYQKYHGKTKRVVNSIVCPADVVVREESRHRLLFVGRLSVNKGIHEIIRALRQLPETYSLTIVGDGEDRERLRALTRELQLDVPMQTEGVPGGRVRFTGAVTPEEVQGYMRASDILIMNSGFEGLPMTILEAQSHALPVVTTDVGGIGEAVHYGVDAEKTDGTAAGIAEAVYKIEADYHSYALHAMENAQRFDYRTVNQTVYDTLVKTGWQ